MIRTLAPVAISIVCLMVGNVRAQTTNLVDVGGYRLEATLAGRGVPAVVIEAGAGGDTIPWRAVRDSLARFTTVITYSRAGHGGSDSSPLSRTPLNIARELQTMLNGLGVDRPIILMGHSFGGPLVRVYAAQFPDEVAGLVLVDGTHERAELEQSKLSPTFWEDTWALVGDWGEDQGGATLKEVTEWWQITTRGTLPEAWPLPDVPMVVLTSMQTDDSWAGGSREGKRIWRDLHSEYLANSTEAIHHITMASGHNFHEDLPGLVVQSVRWVADRSRD